MAFEYFLYAYYDTRPLAEEIIQYKTQKVLDWAT